MFKSILTNTSDFAHITANFFIDYFKLQCFYPSSWSASAQFLILKYIYLISELVSCQQKSNIKMIRLFDKRQSYYQFKSLLMNCWINGAFLSHEFD